MKSRTNTYQLNEDALRISKISDYVQLIKLNLTIVVVLTAIGAFLIASQLQTGWLELAVLGIGGFCVTAASNILNEVLERDYDKLMKRTMNRPLAAGRMSVSEAVLAAGLLSLVGITLLALFNPFCSLLGMIALLLYAFVYTPLKRHSTSAVFIGAISGALPILIGVVAFTGQLTWLALTLFMIQFCWQYPHFWSIAFKSYADYRIAGFKFIPSESRNQLPSRQIGTSSVVMSIAILPLIALLSFSGIESMLSLSLLSVLTFGLIAVSIRFKVRFDNKSALVLLLTSIVYIPAILLVLIIGFV